MFIIPGPTSHLFSHLIHQQTLHPRTSALTPGPTSHLISHLLHQQALHHPTSAQTTRYHLSPFFTSPSPASTSPTHLCTNLRPHAAPRQLLSRHGSTQAAPLIFFHNLLTIKLFTAITLHQNHKSHL